MSQLSDRHLFSDIKPNDLWAKIEQHHGLILPHILQQSAFGHYRESTGDHFGFQMQTPWDALPTGEWRVQVNKTDPILAEKAAYHVDVSVGSVELYCGDLTVEFAPAENGTVVTLTIEGEKKSGLDSYSNELVETILRSLIREGWEAADQMLARKPFNADGHDEGEQLRNHMDPLALAAGVFSAGMAVGLWLWRRKRKDQES